MDNAWPALKDNILIMAPGPINRGVEITADVADGPQSVILEQVTNGIAVRMAVLWLVTHAGNDFSDFPTGKLT